MWLTFTSKIKVGSNSLYLMPGEKFYQTKNVHSTVPPLSFFLFSDSNLKVGLCSVLSKVNFFSLALQPKYDLLCFVKEIRKLHSLRVSKFVAYVQFQVVRKSFVVIK